MHDDDMNSCAVCGVHFPHWEGLGPQGEWCSEECQDVAEEAE